MSARVGGIVHFRPTSWGSPLCCHAALIVAEVNEVLTLKVFDETGTAYLAQNVPQWRPDPAHPSIPPASGMWHERGDCR